MAEVQEPKTQPSEGCVQMKCIIEHHEHCARNYLTFRVQSPAKLVCLFVCLFSPVFAEVVNGLKILLSCLGVLMVLKILLFILTTMYNINVLMQCLLHVLYLLIFV